MGSGKMFALQVKGDSMIDAGILDGDRGIVKQQATAENGEIVCAMINGEAPLKRFFKKGGCRAYFGCEHLMLNQGSLIFHM